MLFCAVLLCALLTGAAFAVNGASVQTAAEAAETQVSDDGNPALWFVAAAVSVLAFAARRSIPKNEDGTYMVPKEVQNMQDVRRCAAQEQRFGKDKKV